MRKLINADFLNNFMGLSSMNLVALIVPLITMPTLTSNLGMESYGVFMLLLAINGFGQGFIGFSFGITAVRDLAKNKNNNTYTSSIYSQITFSQLLLTIVYIIPVIIFAYFDAFYLNAFDILMFSYPVLLSNVFFAIWFHQGISRTKSVVVCNIVARAVFVLYSLFFVNSSNDLHSLMVVYSYSLFGMSILSFVYRLKKYDLKLKYQNPLTRISKGKDAFIGSFSPNLYSNIPGLILPSLINESQFAIFSVALRIIGVANMLQNVISRSLFPVLNSSNDFTVRDVFKINFTVSLLISIFFLVSSDKIVYWLVGTGFEQSIYYIKISVLGILALSITDSISNGYFLVKNKDVKFRNISLSVSFVSFLISIPLLYNFYATGAILTLILARVIFATVYTVSYYKETMK
ncbi:oligosaccharide flippase family protein [Vibrio breoganii]